MHELPDRAVTAGLHAGREGFWKDPHATGSFQNRHQRLAEQAEAIFWPPEIVSGLQELLYSPVSAACTKVRNSDKASFSTELRVEADKAMLLIINNQSTRDMSQETLDLTTS